MVFTSSGVGVDGFCKYQSLCIQQRRSGRRWLKCLSLEYEKEGITLPYSPSAAYAGSKSSAPFPFPAEYKADPRTVGYGLVENINGKGFVIRHSFLQKVQTELCYLFSLRMGRLMSGKWRRFPGGKAILEIHHSNFRMQHFWKSSTTKEEQMSDISIIGVAEGNLKNISLDIPRNKLVVFTGLPVPGKSTLLIDVLYNECQRQYLEAMAFRASISRRWKRGGASPAIVDYPDGCEQESCSTVGTMSDIC